MVSTHGRCSAVPLGFQLGLANEDTRQEIGGRKESAVTSVSERLAVSYHEMSLLLKQPALSHFLSFWVHQCYPLGVHAVSVLCQATPTPQ